MIEHAATKRTRNAQRCELLEQITDRIHDGDDATVDALSTSEEADDIQALVPMLRLLRCLDQASPTGTAREGHAASGELSTEVVLDDFRIIREIGRGGMGVVYEAEQLSLHRPIALKVLPFSASLDVNQLRRFENEVRATASLDHPHIVPIYAVGNIQHVHYYAMQLVKGRSLTEFIAERRALIGNGFPVHGAPASVGAIPRVPRSSIAASENPRAYARRVAHLGIQAAKALQHAHDAGVVHRDIKPSNLLVGDDDYLWITDFGLACISNNCHSTDLGDLVGTLRYMPPEQMLGRAVIADHRADVYSLGVTLYELMTLRPAFAALDHETLRKQVSHYELVRPRQINTSVPRDLETIILKAMAEERLDRYATADDLADDLRRFRENRPIVARRKSVLDRAAKTVRRNAALAWLAAALVASVACGLVAGVMLLAEQRDAALAAAQREHLLAQAARQQEDRAERERRRAEENFSRARQAVDRMLHSATNELAVVGGSDKIRHDLLVDALRFYQGFLQQQPENDAVRYDLAVAYARVGEIHHRLGDEDDAEAATRRALSLLRELADQPRSDPKFRLALAQVLKDLSHVCLELSDHYERATELVEERVRLLKSLFAERPANPAVRRALAVAHTDTGTLLADVGRFDEAESHFQRSLKLWGQDSRRNHLGPQDVQALAATHHKLGSMLMAMTRYQEAGSHMSKALSLQTVTTSDSPESRSRLAHVQQDFALLLCKTGDRLKAKGHLRRAVGTLEHLVAEFPDAVDYAYRCALCHYDLYRVLLALGNTGEAHAFLERGNKYLEGLVQRGELLKYVLPLSRNHYISGSNAYFAGDVVGAAAAFDRVHELLVASTSEFPNSGGLCAQFAWFLATCPDSRHQDAARARRLASSAVEQQPQDAVHWRVLAAAEYRGGNYQAALDALRQSAQLKQGQDGFDLLLLALCHARLGDHLQADEQYLAAMRWLDENPCDVELIAPLRQEASLLLPAADSPVTN